MKNGNIADQLKIQEHSYEHTFVHLNVQTQQRTNVGTFRQANVSTDMQAVNQTIQSDLGLSSVLGLFTPEMHGEDIDELKKDRRD